MREQQAGGDEGIYLEAVNKEWDKHADDTLARLVSHFFYLFCFR